VLTGVRNGKYESDIDRNNRSVGLNLNGSVVEKYWKVEGSGEGKAGKK
jgi:hypothetical protein